MRALLCILVIISFVGCDKGKGNGGEPGKPGPGPGPISKSWGSLPCQKRSNCANPVLNLEIKALSDFVSLKFPKDIRKFKNDDRGQFVCGRQFIDLWMKEFPRHQGASTTEIADIADLGKQVLNTEGCTNHPKVNEQINQYFTNTKEYKDVF